MYTAGAEPFMLYMKIGFLAGIFIASPLILWQVWKFIAPGPLHATRRGSRFRSCCCRRSSSSPADCSRITSRSPWTWKFFISFSTDYMVFMPKIDEAFSLYTKMVLGFGAIFEMPTLVFFLARMGVVTGGIPAALLQVRLPHHLHRRRRDQPGNRHDVAGDHGRSDAGPLHHQHRHRIPLRQEAAGRSPVRLLGLTSLRAKAERKPHALTPRSRGRRARAG